MDEICVTDGGFLTSSPAGSIFVTGQHLANNGYTDVNQFQMICYQKIDALNDMTNLTAVEGLEVGGLLATVLVAGFTIRAIARALNTYEKDDES